MCISSGTFEETSSTSCICPFPHDHDLDSQKNHSTSAKTIPWKRANRFGGDWRGASCSDWGKREPFSILEADDSNGMGGMSVLSSPGLPEISDVGCCPRSQLTS